MKNRDLFIITETSSYQVSKLLHDTRSVIFDSTPSLGVVVGTFASVPYIHLQLEARRRFFPDIPLLVHDDGSAQQEALKSLCSQYGCDFETNDARQPPCIGDVTCFLGGLLWAERRKLDIVVKMSRRFIPLSDWSVDLQNLATSSQYPTYCNHTTTFGFGFRSECVGMAVKEWIGHQIHRDLAKLALSPDMPFVEGVVHNLSRRLANSLCTQAVQWDEQNGRRPSDRDGYAPWGFMGTDRCVRYPHFLWHDSASARDYYSYAAKWGLPYSELDFADPNQGYGNGM